MDRLIRELHAMTTQLKRIADVMAASVAVPGPEPSPFVEPDELEHRRPVADTWCACPTCQHAKDTMARKIDFDLED